MVLTFENFGLAPELKQAVDQLGYEQATPIQQHAIPSLLEGRNVVGQAQTGTGKTAAFVLPMLQWILSQQDRQGADLPAKRAPVALVLAPTRELAIQVTEAAAGMARFTPLKVMSVYGGQSYEIQVRKLERGVDVVVGTPGRLLDLIRQKRLNLTQVRYLVLDEADEMLEMGFVEDVETIMSNIPEDRQIALFSATMPAAVRKLADRYVAEPHEISVSPARLTVAETEQRFCRVREEQKLPALIRMLEAEDVKAALIFARTKIRAQELAEELIRRGYPAESLHGDLSQARREYVLNRFRRHSITMLVATDVAARGLDIQDLTHVFNYDAPGDAEDYVHRIGRTGRAGRKGIAVSFFHPRDRRRLAEIEAYTRQPMREVRVPTVEDIYALRDERFLLSLADQVTAQSADGEHANREQEIVRRLAESGYPLADIAAAAIRLARSGEASLPVDAIETVVESKTFRSRRQTPEKAEANWPAFEKTDTTRETPRFERPRSKPVTRPTHEEKPVREARPHTEGEKFSVNGKAKRRSDPGMVRLRMNLGEVHGLRPSDVVGAIASEVGIPGRAIGGIEIRSNYTFVDISEKHVRQVLRESGGQYLLRGRPVMLKLAN